MNKILSTLCTLLCMHLISYSQVFGPNSPSSHTTAGGGNNWSSSVGITSSDNNRAIVNTNGYSRQLIGRDFGFCLADTDIIEGVEL